MPSTGARNARCAWTTKLATSTVTGRSRCRPLASDQHRRIRSRNGNSDAAGFQMSWNVSAASEVHMSAIATAVMSMSGRPPPARASATAARTAATLTIPIVTAIAAGPPTRTGTASSQ